MNISAMSSRPASGQAFPDDVRISFAGALPSNALECTRIVIYMFFRVLLGTFSAIQRCTAGAHERLCQLFGLSPSAVRGPRQSAIVIVGGDDGELFRLGGDRHADEHPRMVRICHADIGRHIALDFSELGYTVFVLCPDRHRDPQTLASSSTPDASNVSSVREIRIVSLPLSSDAECFESAARAGLAPEDQKVRPLVVPLGFGRPHRAGHDLQRAARPCGRDRRCVLHHPFSAPCCGYRATRAGLHQYVRVAFPSQSSADTHSSTHTHTHGRNAHIHAPSI